MQSEMGLATEQLSQQLLEYEKKVSIDAMIELIIQIQQGMGGRCSVKINSYLPLSVALKV